MKNVLNYINEALNTIENNDSSSELKELKEELSIIDIGNITSKELDNLKEKVNYFDQNFDCLNDIGNLFDYVYFDIKEYINNKEVKELRRMNRVKRLRKEGNKNGKR